MRRLRGGRVGREPGGREAGGGRARPGRPAGARGRHRPERHDPPADRAAALEALEHARGALRHATDVESVEVAGPPPTCLLERVAAEDAGLVAVGTHGLGRVAGIALGSVTTRVLHRAPCSVLVARRPPAGEWAPRTIVVGVDGSPAADAALEAANALGTRLGATVETRMIAEGRVAHGLVEAAANADLLVVGSRGTHGARSLGSVSERVAHEAPCSVLVVRGR